MDLFTRKCVLETIEAADQDEVFRALARRACELERAHDEAAIIAALREREGEASTGFGSGIAIPHTKSTEISEPVVLFARLSEPVEWHAFDGASVSTIISIMVPENGSDAHLQLLAKLARQLVHADFAECLRNSSIDSVYERIREIIA